MNQGFRFTRSVVQEGDLLVDPQVERSLFYEETYLQKHPELHAEEHPDKLCAVLQILDRAGLVIQDLQTIGDMGCGSCRLLGALLDSCGPRTWGLGVDISKRILVQARSHQRLVKLQASVLDLPLPRGTFDLALCIDIVEHLEEPVVFLEEMARVAKVIIVKVPLERSIYTWLRGGEARLWRMRRKYGHLHHFDSKSLRTILENNFTVRAVAFVKIPNRGPVVDLCQEVLLRLRLVKLFGIVFGGFLVACLQPKED